MLSGVIPRCWPSMTTTAPGGLVCTDRVPRLSADGEMIRPTASVPPEVKATRTTAAATQRPRRNDLLFSIALSCSSERGSSSAGVFFGDGVTAGTLDESGRVAAWGRMDGTGSGAGNATLGA